jgi:hypothetical protein
LKVKERQKEEAMHIGDRRYRKVSYIEEIELLRVILYLVRGERAKEEAANKK